MPRYDKSYCEDSKNFKKAGCRHKDTSVHDEKFDKNNNPTHHQAVCTICGRISKWCKYMYKLGRYPAVATVKF